MRILALLLAAAAITAWAEFVHWRASRRRLGPAPKGTPHSEAVIVLGFRDRGRRANALNRFRVRAGLRSFDPAIAERVLVLCGGSAVDGGIPEAELMAVYARERGYRGAIRLDDQSRSTWQNIENAIPLVEHAESIKIVSNSMHAEKGRAYLWIMRPDLGARLRRSKDYRLGEIALLKPIAAVIGLRALARWDRQQRN
jgi:uncharacterized SAM-binding protein YcdF (DUF218 family)